MDIGRRELSAGDIASGAVQAWFANFAPVFLISLLFTVPIYIVNGIAVSGLPETVDDIDDLEVGALLARTFGSTAVSYFLSLFLAAALAYAFIRIFRGEEIVPGDAGRAVLENIGALLIFSIITSLLIAIGFVLLIVPGVALVIAFSLGAPAIMNERIGGTSAISRCFRLISGNWGVALVVVLIGLLVSIVVGAIFGGLTSSGGFSTFDFSDFNAGRALLQILASALVAPLIPALATALYFEVKGRNEGFPSIVEPTEEMPGF